MRGAAILAAFFLAGCAATGTVPGDPYPPAGVTIVTEGPIVGAEGRNLVAGTINLAPGGEVPRHIHDGEEFLTVIGGSATVFLLSPDWSRTETHELIAGTGMRIAPGTVHWAIAGPDGVRATASWIVLDGQPLRRDVATPTGQ